MAEDGEDEYIEVKLIFIGGEKQTSQRMIDKYIETLKNEDRLLSTGEDETKPIISLINGMKTKLILSTTDGKDKYRSLTTTYFKNSKKVYITYKMENRQTADSLEKWLTLVQTYCDYDVNICILGFGKPVGDNQRTVEKVTEFANENRLVQLFCKETDGDMIDFMKREIETGIVTGSQTPRGRKQKNESNGCCILL